VVVPVVEKCLAETADPVDAGHAGCDALVADYDLFQQECIACHFRPLAPAIDGDHCSLLQHLLLQAFVFPVAFVA